MFLERKREKKKRDRNKESKRQRDKTGNECSYFLLSWLVIFSYAILSMIQTFGDDSIYVCVWLFSSKLLIYSIGISISRPYIHDACCLQSLGKTAAHTTLHGAAHSIYQHYARQILLYCWWMIIVLVLIQCTKRAICQQSPIACSKSVDSLLFRKWLAENIVVTEDSQKSSLLIVSKIWDYSAVFGT